MDRLAYTVDEAAEATTLSPTEIRNRIRSGELVAAKVGRRWVIRRDRLDAWLADHEQAAK